MYEDEEFRNYYEDDGYDGRNAFFNRGRRRRRPHPGNYGGAMVGPRPYPVAPAPWAQPVPPPVVDRFSGQIRLGMILDAAAQILASMASLPSAPTATGEGRSDMANLMAYQTALAQHAKRDEQIRTVGALARLFMV